MGLRRMIAVWAAKLTEKISVHIFHKQGVTWAGKIAMKICPDILTQLAAQVKEGIFIVCGTNGKTTTNNMLCAALEEEGKKVVCNHTGSNMLNGVAASMVLAAGWSGNLKADFACLEVDEASTRRVFPFFKPDYMVLTNLFRDQLDRYGEIDTTMHILNEMMKSAPDMKVIVNADDALSAFIAVDAGNKLLPFGINEQVMHEDSNEVREGRFCKRCGAPLKYEFYHYSQLGNYACTNCDFKRPETVYNAEDIDIENGIDFSVDGYKIHANYKGFYNVYNILAAYAAGRSAGLEMNHFNDMLKKFNPENGRMETFRIKDTEIILNLAKNPAGFNQNIQAVMQDERKKNLIISINDKEQDGIDVSWLWDVDFDRFAEDSIASITVCGIRRYDMALRLKYVDIQTSIEDDIESAINKCVENGTGVLYMLVNYTALGGTRSILKRLEEQK